MKRPYVHYGMAAIAMGALLMLLGMAVTPRKTKFPTSPWPNGP